MLIVLASCGGGARQAGVWHPCHLPNAASSYVTNTVKLRLHFPASLQSTSQIRFRFHQSNTAELECSQVPVSLLGTRGYRDLIFYNSIIGSHTRMWSQLWGSQNQLRADSHMHNVSSDVASWPLWFPSLAWWFSVTVAEVVGRDL